MAKLVEHLKILNNRRSSNRCLYDFRLNRQAFPLIYEKIKLKKFQKTKFDSFPGKFPIQFHFHKRKTTFITTNLEKGPIETLQQKFISIIFIKYFR